jgi:multisubunit Na+/H+ antiporter MnhE subunit
MVVGHFCFHPLFIEVLVATIDVFFKLLKPKINCFHPLFIEVLVATEAEVRVFRLSRLNF